MNFRLVRELMLKDLQEIRKNGYVFLSILFLPFILVGAGLFSMTSIILSHPAAGTSSALEQSLSVLPSLFASMLVMIPGIITTLIGSTSIVMEKNNRSLEPLLGTPITDSELFLGKAIAPFIPAILVAFLAFGLYIVGIDALTEPKLGYFILPTSTTYLDMFFLAPVIGLLGTFTSLLVSSKMKDVRAAQQVSSLVVLPVILLVLLPLFAAGQNFLVSVIFGIILLAMVMALYFVTVKAFRRETILVSWK